MFCFQLVEAMLPQAHGEQPIKRLHNSGAIPLRNKHRSKRSNHPNNHLLNILVSIFTSAKYLTIRILNRFILVFYRTSSTSIWPTGSPPRSIASTDFSAGKLIVTLANILTFHIVSISNVQSLFLFF